MKFFALSLAALTLAILPASALSQAQLDAAVRRGVVEKAATTLRERYIYPDAAEKAAAELEQRLAAGAYDGITQPAELARRLTQELQASTKDRHLRVNFNAGGAPISAPPSATGGPPPPLPPATGPGGIVRADRLAGNIGYIEIINFPGLNVFKPNFDQAMAALADTSALIVDMRRNTGGAVGTPIYFASWFIDSREPIKLGEVITRVPGLPVNLRRSENMSQVTTGKYVGKPVYILISPMTFSAGEAAVYTLHSRKLAKTVGATTGGGAHPTTGAPLTAGFGMAVPYARGEGVETKTDWEGVGIPADIPVPPAEALRAALKALGQNPEAGDIATLSQAQLFGPRTSPIPGSEQLLRKTIESIARGEVDETLQTPQRAQGTRRDLERLRYTFAGFGPIQSMRLLSTGVQGGDLYEVKLAHATINWLVLLEDGKVSNWSRQGAYATDAQRMAAFRAGDPDGDGKADRAGYRKTLELLAAADTADALFELRDTNKDGFVSADEHRVVLQP